METKKFFSFNRSAISVQNETDTPIISAPTSEPTGQIEHPEDAPLILDEIVIEEISIDGMCGVY